MNKWKKIKEFEGYVVSFDGEVKNTNTGHILKPSMTKNGYCYVCFFKNGKTEKRYVHRLVAEAFLKNESKPQVNHINGIKTDNRVENLEWCTSSENHMHRSRVLGIKNSPENMERLRELARKAHCKAVVCVENGIVYESVTAAANAIGKAPCSLTDALNGRHKTCGGFHWKYFMELCGE